MSTRWEAFRQGLRRHGLRLLIALVIGAATGLAVFSIGQVTGRNLFIITGGLAGVLTVSFMQLYGRAARLSEITVKVPQVSDLTFVVNNDSRQMAWHLFVETATRVSTQPLGHDEGLVREALTSLYGLFTTTRDTLKAGRPSKAVPGGHTVEYLAITMLNQELRPFLSLWHPRLHAYELAHPHGPEAAWTRNAECRAALHAVQRDLHAYALGFAQLAGVHDPRTLLGGPEDAA
ncbi:hypothetical protein ACIPSA_29965 [Streptomyces sp. NPDC086549]|uniref:hypothetical protein n=1 Tax=Streptomyces sp. NPDC086549 TaxID=3365752 RepID=UPI003817635D